MAKNFATVKDIIEAKRALTPEETERAEKLLTLVSDSLRVEAFKRGKDLDVMISNFKPLATVAKSVCMDVVMRELMTPTNETPVTQYSEGALGYTASATYLVPGGGLFIKKAELSRLGITGGRVRVTDISGLPEVKEDAGTY